MVINFDKASSNAFTLPTNPKVSKSSVVPYSTGSIIGVADNTLILILTIDPSSGFTAVAGLELL
jgi:hypothetical protein